MALDARTRSSIYEKLRHMLGDDDANALMSHFPADEGDQLVTRDILRAELAETRLLANIETGLLRSEMATGFAEVRSEMATSISGLQVDMHDFGRRMIAWSVATMLTGMGMVGVITHLTA